MRKIIVIAATLLLAVLPAAFTGAPAQAACGFCSS